MKKKTKKILFIVSIISTLILILALGIFYFIYSNTNQSVVGSNIIYQKIVSSITGINLNECWNGNTIISISPIENKYKIYYTKGCPKPLLPVSKTDLCDYLSSGNKKITNNTIKVFIRSDSFSEAQIKRSYQTTINNILNAMDSPVRDYDYVFYYQSREGACSNIPGYTCDFSIKFDVEGNPKEYYIDGAGFAEGFFDGEVTIKPTATSGVIAHENGHAFGLPDEYWGNFAKLHPEYKNNLMTTGKIPGAKFTQDQRDLIFLYINMEKYSCELNNLKSSCSYPDKSCTQSKCTLTGGVWHGFTQYWCDCKDNQIWNNGCQYSQRLIDLRKIRTDYFNLNSKIDSLPYKTN